MGRTDGLDADVVVVGGGLAGSAAALRLSERGLTVLVLEAGPAEDVVTAGRPTAMDRITRILPRPGQGIPPDPTLTPYYLADSSGDGTRRQAPTRLGRGVGGSSQFYAAALGRFRRSDFAQSPPGMSTEPSLPDGWPVDFEEFSEYYTRAEALLRIRGEADPLDPDSPALTGGTPLPELTPGSVRLQDALRRRGLHPYRLRVGIEYVAGCAECFTARCPRSCKADGNNRLLVRARASGRVRVEVNTEAREITRCDGGLRVLALGPDGEQVECRGRRVVLAAGALATPLLLDRSTTLWTDLPRPPMLGRGLMFHVTDTWAVDMREDAVIPKKWLGLRDFYADGTHNAGEIQSTGGYLTPGPIVHIMRTRLARTPLRHVPAAALTLLAWVVARVMGRRPIFAAITEDLPHARNRVREDGGVAVVDYAVDPLLRARTAEFRTTVRQIFGPSRVMFTANPGEPNWGHPMGTCRMGTDPAVAVTTPDGQVHGHPHLYVADASTFPSSGGTGPGLTVVAQALRVADRLADACRPVTPVANAVDDLRRTASAPDGSSS